MTIKVKIKPTIPDAEEEKPIENPLKMKLQMRRTMDGYFIITDHPEIIITIMPQKNKIVAYSREEFGDHVYDAQDRLFSYLSIRGVVKPETIRGGQVYGSIEAQYPEESAVGGKPEDLVTLAIAKFIEEERPYYMADEAREKQFEKWLLSPDEEASTELGEIPAAQTKGSIPKVQTRRYITGLYESVIRIAREEIERMLLERK